MLDGVPTCLARHHDGSYLFERCVAGMNLNGIDRIIITVLERDNSAFDIEHKIYDSPLAHKNKIEVCVLPEKTNGPAETVYRTIKLMNIDDRIIVKDVDNFVAVSAVEHPNFVVGVDIFDYDVRNLKTKSFITINEQNNILDIIEKQIKSNYICVGLYGFQSAADFVKSCEALSDPNYGIEKLYVSHVITYLIGRYDRIFQYAKADQFESYGSQDELNELKRHAVVATGKKLALFDLDGTLFNTNEVNYRAYQEALEHFGFKFERDYWYGNCVGRHYRDFLSDIGITDEPALLAIHKLKKQAYKKYLGCAKENLRLFDLIELMRAEYNIVLVTTASRKNVEDILNAFGRMKTFDKIFTQEDVSKMKPDPECYLKAMADFNAAPEDTIIFEDSDAGLAAADASGAHYFRVFKFN